MKKAVVFILLLSFLFQIFGYHLVFQYRKFDLKKSAKRLLRRRVDPSLTETFSFPLLAGEKQEMPQWVDQFEFRFHDQLYDVIEKKVVGDRLVIRCLNDIKEKQLIDHYKMLAQQDFDQKSKKRSLFMLKMLGKALTSSVFAISTAAPVPIPLNSDPRRLALSRIFTKVLTPPPRFC